MTQGLINSLVRPPILSVEQLRLLQGAVVTIIGFGSLLSETSSRTTFPDLTNFRLGRVEGYRRVFRHPAAIFYERGIALPETKEVSSLSAEPADGHGFVCSLFEIPNFDVTAFINREEEFDFALPEYTELTSGRKGQGLMCICGADERVEERWGEGYVAKTYGKHGVSTIWGWGPDSGILPCPVYLRHCVLASSKQGPEAHTSFLRETFLADRSTTIEDYLRRRPDIMDLEPPPAVAHRYTG